MTRLGERVARLPTPLRQVAVEVALVVEMVDDIVVTVRQFYGEDRPQVYELIREYRAARRVPRTGQETTDAR